MNLLEKNGVVCANQKMEIGLLRDAWVNVVEMIHKPKQRCGDGCVESKYVRYA